MTTKDELARYFDKPEFSLILHLNEKPVFSISFFLIPDCQFTG
jgi:hypothetical protein